MNNAWGGHEAFSKASFGAPFWEQALDQWDAMFDRGVRNHLLASRIAAPVLIRQGRGLIVTTSFWDRGNYLRGNLFYDLAKAAMNRLAFAMAEELRPHGVASLAVVPGWMRTEFVLAGHKTDEAHWRDHPALARTESPRYVGRAVAALAADPEVHGQERRHPPRGRPGAWSTASRTSTAASSRRSSWGRRERLALGYNPGYTESMKTAISLPDELFSAATALADRLGMSRSELYATALAEFVAKHNEREITARLDQLYATEPSGLDEVFRRAQRESIGKEAW